MEFLNPGEKVKNIRKLLGLKQEKLEEIGVSRNFISMVEHDKRKLNKRTAKRVLDIFELKAKELNLDLNIDVKYLLTDAAEEAAVYCREKLNGELSIEEIENLIELCNKYNIIEDILPSLYIKKADLLYEKSIYDEAFVNYYNAFEIYNNNRDTLNKAFVYNKLGKCKLMTLDLAESLAYFLRSYNLSNECNDVKIKKYSLYNLSLVYGRLDRLEEAIKCIDNYILLCDSKNDFYNVIDAEILRGICFFKEGKYEKSIENYIKILASKEQINDATLALIYNNLGVGYFEINNLDSSIEYFNKAQQLKENKDITKLCRTLIDKSKVYIKYKLTNEAIKLLNEGLDMAIIYSDVEYIINSYNLLEEIYISLHDEKSLNLLYNKILFILKDKANSEQMINIYAKICVKALIHNCSKEDEDFKTNLMNLNFLLNKL